MGNDLTNSYNSTSAFVGNSIEGAFNTPIKQQFTNFVNFLDQPTTLEMGLTLYATGRLPFKGSSLGTAPSSITSTSAAMDYAVIESLKPTKPGFRVVAAGESNGAIRYATNGSYLGGKDLIGKLGLPSISLETWPLMQCA